MTIKYFKKILNLIYENNINKNKTEILIISAIKNKDINNLINKLQKIKKIIIAKMTFRLRQNILNFTLFTVN